MKKIIYLILSTSFLFNQYALHFDGQDDWVEVENNGTMSLSGQNQFSIQVWYKTIGGINSITTTIFDHYTQPSQGQPHAWGLYIYSGEHDGRTGFWYRSDDIGEENSIISDHRIDDGEWHHIAVEKYSNGNVSLFVDGAKQSQEMVMSSNAMIDNGGNYGIGSGHHSRYQNCMMSEVILSTTNTFYEDFDPEYSFTANESTIGHWKFDEGEGNILYDHSGNGNNGDLRNMDSSAWTEYFPEGYPDNGNFSLNFDGSDDEVYIGDQDALDVAAEDFSLQVMIKTGSIQQEQTGQTGYIISKRNYSLGNGYELCLTTDGRVRPGILSDDNETSTTHPQHVNDNEWHSITAVFDRDGYLVIYVDGVPSEPVVLGIGDNINNSHPFYIGEFSSNDGRNFAGEIAKVVVWKKSLSQSEVQNNLSLEYDDMNPEIAGYWKFNEGDGDTLYDYSDNQNHGTIQGNPDWLSVDEAFGCNDSYACNYDGSTINDGSCDYSCHNNENRVLYFNSQEQDYAELAPASILQGYNSYTIEIVASKINNNAPANTPLIESGPYGNSYFAAFYGNDDRFRFTHWSDGGPVTQTALGNNTFTLLSLTYNQSGNTGTVFIDGVYEGQSTLGSDFNSFDQIFTIGGSYMDHGFLNGYIDEVRIWNHARTEEQIYSYAQENEQSLTGTESGLLALYKFNEGPQDGGILIDYSGNQNHGQQLGSEFVYEYGCGDQYAENSGVYSDGSNCTYLDNGNYFLSFDGSTDYVEINNSQDLNPSTDLAVSLWFKTQDEERVQYIFGNEASSTGFSLHMREDGRLWFQMEDVENGNQVSASEESFNDGDWHHFFATWSTAGVGKIYVDWQEITYSSQLVVTNYEESSFPFVIGDKLDNNDNSFNGSIDEIKMWHRTLSALEIQSIYQNNDSTSDYVAYWKFNEGEGDILHDYSGNQNHGNIYGNLTWLEPVYDCLDENACNYNQDADFGNDSSCLYPEDFGWCNCDGELPDQCGVCGGNNDCYLTSTAPIFERTFTTCGVQYDSYGPSFETCYAAYEGTDLESEIEFLWGGGFQFWNRPQGVYYIEARGAKGGGANPGLGATVSGYYDVSWDDYFVIAVGQTGESHSSGMGGGGGGTFLYDAGINAVFMVAGGGGGSGSTNDNHECSGAGGSDNPDGCGTDIDNSLGCTDNDSSVDGGCSGNGGIATNPGGGSGAGFYGSGDGYYNANNSSGKGGYAWQSNSPLQGGHAHSVGGFGGAGSSAHESAHSGGGGGGYSGGAGGAEWSGGGGGGSWTNTSWVNFTANNNDAQGQVFLQYFGDIDIDDLVFNNINNLYLDSQQIQKGETVEVPIYLNSEEPLNGLIFNVDINANGNTSIESDLNMVMDVDGSVIDYQADSGSASFAVTFNESISGEGQRIASLVFNVPDSEELINGDVYSVSLLDVSGSNDDYETVEMIDYQNVELFVITSPPEISLGLSDVYIMEGDSISVSFSVTDQENMPIYIDVSSSLDYISLNCDEGTYACELTISPDQGAVSGEVTITAQTEDLYPETTQETLWISVNHYVVSDLSAQYNVTAGDTWETTGGFSDEDGDSFNVEYSHDCNFSLTWEDNTLSGETNSDSEDCTVTFTIQENGNPSYQLVFTTQININHYPVCNDMNTIHIIYGESECLEDFGCSDIDDGDVLECTFDIPYGTQEDEGICFNPSESDNSATFTITCTDPWGLSASSSADIILYETFIAGDVRPHFDNFDAGGFGNEVIDAPDVVNILKVAVNIVEAPDSLTDLFDAFDTHPEDQDANGDGDYYDENERGGNGEISVLDAQAVLLIAMGIHNPIERVDRDYPYSSRTGAREEDPNRTNDLIVLEGSDVYRGQQISIPITLERGSVEGLTSFALGFELSSDDECLSNMHIEFIPNHSESNNLDVYAINSVFGIMNMDIEPLSANTSYVLGTVDFAIPLIASPESTFTLRILGASGGTSDYESIGIDIVGSAGITIVNDEIWQDESLHSGPNLVSFYAIPEDNSLENMFPECLNGTVNGIIGEGIAATCISNVGWVGALANTGISSTSGYWLLVNNGYSPLYEQSGYSVYENWNHETIHYGQNLIAYPCLTAQAISDVISDDFEDAISGIIGEGVASSNNPVLGWIGSLDKLIPGKGYWFDFTFNFDEFYFDCVEPECEDELPRLLADEEFELPEELNYSQSTQQAFYFVKNIHLDQLSINDGDWLVAFHGNTIVGARAWTGEYTDIPAMGFDGGSYSEGYINQGEAPAFKLYQDGVMYDLYGSVPEFSNLSIYEIELFDSEPLPPEAFILSEAYPNPFNPQTTIHFEIPEEDYIVLSVYDVNGRMIETLVSKQLDAGYYDIEWDASPQSSGVYFVKMVGGKGFSDTAKLMLIK